MNTANSSFPAQADLRYLLTLQTGHIAGLYGSGTALSATLEQDGLATRPFPSTDKQKLNAVFILGTLPNGLEETFREITQSLAENGQALLCLPNRNSIQYFRKRLQGNATQDTHYTIEQVKRAAQRAGLNTRAIYGIYNSIKEPRFLIPLEHRGAVQHFFNAMLIPYSGPARQLTQVAPALIALGLQPSLFAELAFVMDTTC